MITKIRMTIMMENNKRLDEKYSKDLFEQIRRYGSFLAEFGCTNDLGMALRVRVAEYDGKKYFIVQCDGSVAELFEI